MTDPREIEAKFDIDKRDRDVLLAATSIGDFTVQGRTSADQEDIYFDTADWLLAASGSTLRVRRTAKGARMTFKGMRESGAAHDEAHIASRLEDEVSLDRNQASQVSIDAALPAFSGVSPLVRARAIVHDAELRPVAHMQNRRETIELIDASGSTLELALDDCVGTRLSDGRRIEFDEVEIETKTADRTALIGASSALRALVPSLEPSSATKLSRTLG